MEPNGHDADRNIAGNLRAIRGSKGLSQTAVAREMNERGWPWHQTTVTRVERGEQGAGYGEAVDLAAVLGVPLERLTMPAEGAAEVAAAEELATSLRRTWIAAVKAVRALHRVTEEARAALPTAEASRHPRVREIAEEIGAGLGQYTLDAAIAEAGAAAG